jgi:hypothetical protein
MICPHCNNETDDQPTHYPLVTLIRRGQQVDAWLVDAPIIGGFRTHGKYNPRIPVIAITDEPLDIDKAA